jgi:amidophosphoribosyltransferase
VFAVFGHPEAARVAFFGLFALQHRGQESAGICSTDGCHVWDHKGMGLVSEVFHEPTLVPLKGSLAIGHVRYSTTGSSTLANAQPFVAHHGEEYYAIGHNGNLTNTQTRDPPWRTGAPFFSPPWTRRSLSISWPPI